jgi:hypothetical protein
MPRQVALNLNDIYTADPRGTSTKSFKTYAEQLGACISQPTASRAKHACRDARWGAFDEGWGTVWAALREVKKANPGSVIHAAYDDNGRFESAFIMLAQSQVRPCSCLLLGASCPLASPPLPSRSPYPPRLHPTSLQTAAAHCKPVGQLDFTHHQGSHELGYINFVGADGNDHIVPVAMAIVRSETRAAYKYFFDHLFTSADPAFRAWLRDKNFLCIHDRGSSVVPEVEASCPDWHRA